jgi:uncharacterized protein YndB with AHSA1/START domain
MFFFGFLFFYVRSHYGRFADLCKFFLFCIHLYFTLINYNYKMENKNELILERVLDAPREKVWQAWTDPEMIKKWWGPNNVSIPECEIDLRVGGKIYIVMEAGEGMGPYQGTRWPMLGKFRVVAPNGELSYDVEAWTEGQKEETTIKQTTELILTEEDDKTKLKIRAMIHQAGPGARMAVEGMEYGFTEQLEKLKEFLEKTQRE